MMYCPKCKAEYREGYKECSECGVDLVPGVNVKNKRDKISKEGISIVKFGITLLFVCIFQFIAVLIIYDFYWVYKLKTYGKAYCSAIQNIHPTIWFLCIVELIIAFIVIIWGSRLKESLEKN